MHVFFSVIDYLDLTGDGESLIPFAFLDISRIWFHMYKNLRVHCYENALA